MKLLVTRNYSISFMMCARSFRTVGGDADAPKVSRYFECTRSPRNHLTLSFIVKRIAGQLVTVRSHKSNGFVRYILWNAPFL